MVATVVILQEYHVSSFMMQINQISFHDSISSDPRRNPVCFDYVRDGTQVKSANSDEPDGMDQAYYFDDRVVIDDIRLDHLIKFQNPHLSVILMNDCCHSSSIWDLIDV
jgi:hypothetical protein